jgi:hypothetical protein
MSSPEKVQVFLRLDPDLCARIDQARGVTARSHFCEALLEAAMSGQGVFDLKPAEKAPPPATVTVDVGPVIGEQMALMLEHLQEILGTTYRTERYLHSVAPSRNHNELKMQVRDEAQRSVWRWLGRNNGGKAP